MGGSRLLIVQHGGILAGESPDGRYYYFYNCADDWWWGIRTCYSKCADHADNLSAQFCVDSKQIIALAVIRVESGFMERVP